MGVAGDRNQKVWTFEDNTVEFAARGQDVLRVVRNGSDVLMVRFRSPHAKSFFRSTPVFDSRANEEFMLQVYAPQGQATDVAIMFNGLDETQPQLQTAEKLFALYDDLGTRLAKGGVLAILLPHPFHMNRFLAVTQSHADSGKPAPAVLRPSHALYERPESIYKNHFQALKETVALLRFLRGGDAHSDLKEFGSESVITEPAAAAVRAHLTSGFPVRVHLIGYSLGGLRAMSTFLRDRIRARHDGRRPFFCSCICVNSGGGLTSLPSPFWVDRDQWRRMIQRILEVRLFADEKKFNGIDEPADRLKAAEHFRFLDDVFLGNGDSLNLLTHNAARSMFFIVGGDDTLVPLKSLERLVPPGGLNLLQVAGMGHILSIDEQWRRWKGIVGDMIVNFIHDQASLEERDSLSPITLACAIALDKGMHLFPHPESVRRNHEGWIRVANERIDQWLSQEEDGFVEVLRTAGARNVTKQGLGAFARQTVNQLFAVVGEATDKRLFETARRKYLFGHYLPDADRRAGSNAWKQVAEYAEAAGLPFGRYMVSVGAYDQGEVNQAAERQQHAVEELMKLLGSAYNATS